MYMIYCVSIYCMDKAALVMHRNRSEESILSIQKDIFNYKDWIDLYWKHFQLHSDQRIKMLQFYLSLIVVLFGALFTLHSMESRNLIAEIVVCIGIGVISVVFALLDHRTSLLIKDAEDAIKGMEAVVFSSDEDKKFALFINSEKNDAERKYFSYAECIRLSEILIALLGVGLALMICCGFF